MALGATIYRFEIELSDIDRGVYEKLDLRLAKHPSETLAYLLMRTIAYCLSYQEGIAFSRGLSTNEEPAVWIKDLQGVTTTWIEVGSPSAERLHKASKATAEVVVYTHHDPALLMKQLAGHKIHNQAGIAIYSVAPRFLDDLAARLERHTRFE